MGKRKEVVPPLHCANIREYEKSPWWTKKSRLTLENKECTCAICGRKRWSWQVRKKVWKRMWRFCLHHIRYTNCPHEKEEDILILCCACHDFFHTIFKYKKMAPVYEELYEWAQKYFRYEGHHTFVPW